MNGVVVKLLAAIESAYPHGCPHMAASDTEDEDASAQEEASILAETQTGGNNRSKAIHRRTLPRRTRPCHGCSRGTLATMQSENMGPVAAVRT